MGRHVNCDETTGATTLETALVLMSARLTAERILKEVGSPKGVGAPAHRRAMMRPERLASVEERFVI